MWAMVKYGLSAAAFVAVAWLLVGLFIVPTTTPVLAALDPVLRATGAGEMAHVVLQVRTREGEDFSFVDPDARPMRVEAWIEWPGLPGVSGRLRVEKRDRVLTFDGSQSVLHRVAAREAYRRDGPAIDTSLFWPAAWVRYLRHLPPDGVEVLELVEESGEGRMLLREPGVETAPREPAFLGEFERETEVVWDLETLRLTSLRRWVYRDGERVLFSETESIDYPAAVDSALFEPDLPADVRWGGVEQGPVELLDLGPREVAGLFFDAASRGDRALLELLCPSPAAVDWLLDEDRRPIVVERIGEPYRTGAYAGVYVPYAVRFGGELRQHPLALRNDNPQHRWVTDGGL